MSGRVAQVHDQRVEIVSQEATYAVALDGPGYLPQLGDATLALRHIVLPGRAEVLVCLVCEDDGGIPRWRSRRRGHESQPQLTVRTSGGWPTMSTFYMQGAWVVSNSARYEFP